jgi:predicted RND superfamily exporter protein
MWATVSSFILRQRIPILIVLALITAFMAYQAQYVKLIYKFGGLLPETDSTQIKYNEFIDKFSEDGNVIVIGLDDPNLYKLENFKAWYSLGKELRTISVEKDTLVGDKKETIQKAAVDSIFSVAWCYNLYKDTLEGKFAFNKVVSQIPETQAEVDSIKEVIYNLPFYDGLLYTQEGNSSLMMVFVNAGLFNSEDRGNSVDQIVEKIDKFSTDTGIQLHISGLPYIRTVMMNKVKKELNFFILLAAIVTAFLLFVFFRNISVVLVSMSVVGIGVAWSIGMMALLDYPISMLMGLIPPLIIVIGVPNCVYLVNKYHGEFKKHGNKAKSLSRVIQKVGTATFMTNATTAVGFATFIFTDSDLLKHFGIIASINIMAVFVISLIVVPTIYSFLPPPDTKHVRHLDRKWIYIAVNQLVNIVTNHRKAVYLSAIVVVALGLYGISLIKTTGNIVDDLPDSERVISDLQFFEDRFNGVMPFEVLIDTGKKGAATKPAMLQKIDEFQRLLETYPEFSRSISIVDASKFAKQAFYNGSPDRYDLIKRNEQSFIGPYLSGDYETRGIEKTFLDSSRQLTRVTAQVADIGTLEMRDLLNDLRPKVDSIFDPTKFNVTITGTSIVFLEGTNYLVNNLFTSLVIAILVIAFLMSLLFRSARMVIISLIPNIIPLVFTAGVMGYLGIAIKPSTILVFSVALGISVDDTIHFLAKYRQELKVLQWNIKDSVLLAVRETGVSMMYTSIILFFGFGIFAASGFEGTQALGILVSMTLLVAMFTNLVMLPSLLLSFHKHLTTKAFAEPLLVIIDEEDDIDIEELQVRQGTFNKEN